MPAEIIEPSGQIVGGGGGGGGHGAVAATTEPSAQVCVAGATGRVAHAESRTVPAKSNSECFTCTLLLVVIVPGCPGGRVSSAQRAGGAELTLCLHRARSSRSFGGMPETPPTAVPGISPDPWSAA